MDERQRGPKRSPATRHRTATTDKTATLQPARELAKRAIDLTIATLTLIAASPLLAATGLWVWATMGRPVLYVDERAGRHGTPFRLLKFRSMRELRAGEKIPDNDADRVTRIGRFTRATSIDELPSLLNVIRGQMSLVGPRPLPVRYTDRLSPQHRRRLEVRPGITGLAQCAGRNSLSWDDRFDLDVRYVDERTLVGDLRLMAKTLAPVLLRRNVGHGEQLTMPEFGLDPQPEHQHGGDGGTH